MDAYQVTVDRQRFELEEKRSRFITSVMRVEGRLDFYLNEKQITVIGKSFNRQVIYSLQIPKSQFDQVSKELNDLSQGLLAIQ